VVSALKVFELKVYKHLSSVSYMLHTLPTSSFFIWSWRRRRRWWWWWWWWW